MCTQKTQHYGEHLAGAARSSGSAHWHRPSESGHDPDESGARSGVTGCAAHACTPFGCAPARCRTPMLLGQAPIGSCADRRAACMPRSGMQPPLAAAATRSLPPPPPLPSPLSLPLQGRRHVGRVSLLYTLQEAADIDADTIYRIGVEGEGCCRLVRRTVATGPSCRSLPKPHSRSATLHRPLAQAWTSCAPSTAASAPTAARCTGMRARRWTATRPRQT